MEMLSVGWLNLCKNRFFFSVLAFYNKIRNSQTRTKSPRVIFFFSFGIFLIMCSLFCLQKSQKIKNRCKFLFTFFLFIFYVSLVCFLLEKQLFTTNKYEFFENCKISTSTKSVRFLTKRMMILLKIFSLPY
jgi:hypothetical protein